VADQRLVDFHAPTVARGPRPSVSNAAARTTLQARKKAVPLR
jgi:hypothetical protein